MDNIMIADRLRQHARDLEAEGGNLLRVRAYRRAAQLIEESDESIADIAAAGGRRALLALPHIGSHIALTIENMLDVHSHAGK
jgi:DNA polymerase/3'-5' exonuclease PolX